MSHMPEESAAHFAPSPGAPREALPASADGAATREGRFDVVVVGAGHAGCEAAHACARMGLSTALLTVQVTDTAKMSCNPAIGGVAKGHMVRELDALGGVMGRVTDRAGIQFKMLNRGRGPAVWSPRAQCDKALYSAEMLRLLGGLASLRFVEGLARRVRVVDGRAAGVELTDGRVLESRAVIITPGTFLNGVLHMGERRLAGGRLGEHAARALSECLAELGFERGRLKTGTPPRLHRDSIDFAALEVAPGDDPPEPFSHWTDRLQVDQVACWTTHTNERTHAVIRDNMARSPLYSGAITGSGPRYCPSLEDKVVKFPERVQHHLFLEPEGRDVDEIYVNGVSTSMPEEVQLEFIRTIRGLERATMIRPGYAVEYDFVRPHQLDATLQSRRTPGLWLAGQICGTSGYEEAAAQGFIAGVNAARAIRGEASFVLRRDQAYIGVLVDDLVTRGVIEPYRLFTSRAEYRLLLRNDNADLRLAHHGIADESFIAFGDTTLLGLPLPIWLTALCFFTFGVLLNHTVFGRNTLAIGAGANVGQALAGYGQGLTQTGLAANQALLAGGTLGQQTQQALNTALYNQFLQKQGYPFQVAQFLANIAYGAPYPTTTTTTQPMGLFGALSDRRAKKDIKRVGKTDDGMPIYKYKYKGDPSGLTHMGLMAQDVEKEKPEAVGLAGGYKTVDYDRATKFYGGGVGDSMGGAVMEPGAYADGGLAYADGGLADILAIQRAMYGQPGGAQGGFGGSPYGKGIVDIVPLQPFRPDRPGAPQQIKQAGLADAMANAEMMSKLVRGGKSALVGSAATDREKAEKGLLGEGGEWDVERGWLSALKSKFAADGGLVEYARGGSADDDDDMPYGDTANGLGIPQQKIQPFRPQSPGQPSDPSAREKQGLSDLKSLYGMGEMAAKALPAVGEAAAAAGSSPLPSRCAGS